MTVVLALERYLAITKPIAYHNAIQGTNPWRRVLNYVVPVVLASALFNIPKFFETEVKWLAPDGTEWKPPEEEREHRCATARFWVYTVGRAGDSFVPLVVTFFCC